MLFAAIVSSLLLAGPMTQEAAIQEIRQAHLDTSEGRLAFLQGSLLEFVQGQSS